jgi:hypothetical protein
MIWNVLIPIVSGEVSLRIEADTKGQALEKAIQICTSGKFNNRLPNVTYIQNWAKVVEYTRNKYESNN